MDTPYIIYKFLNFSRNITCYKEGHLRSILGSITVKEIYKNRKVFPVSIEVALQELAKVEPIIV